MVTMEDIAKKVGVSRSAVSFVLNPRQTRRANVRISDSTRRRVLHAAEELGYHPNASAIAVSTGRFGCVALLLSTIDYRSSLFRGLLDGIDDALARRDLHLTLARVPDEKLTSEGFVPKILRQWMADGLLINYSQDIPEPLLGLVRRHTIPSVWINSRQDQDCVHPGDFEAGREATEHLLRLGHRGVAYAGHPTSTHYSVADRYAGYARAMQEAGLAPRALEGKDSAPPAEWLSARDRPTAVVAYGPSSAGQILYAALSLGLRVPRDLSLVTFEERVADDFGLPLTTWLLPEYAMGQSAVAMLLTKIEEPGRSLPSRALPFSFAAGDSCAPPT